MTGRRSVETPIDDTFPKYLTDKGKGDAGEGAYRTDAERELHRFRRWCLGNTSDPANASPPESWSGVVDGDTVRFVDLDTTVFSDYARYLSTAGYAAGTGAHLLRARRVVVRVGARAGVHPAALRPRVGCRRPAPRERWPPTRRPTGVGSRSTAT